MVKKECRRKEGSSRCERKKELKKCPAEDGPSGCVSRHSKGLRTSVDFNNCAKNLK